MTPMIGCEVARPLLDEYVDGELGMERQILVQGHLRVCRSCSAHVEDLGAIGGSLRLGAARVPEVDLEAVVSQVSWQVHVEQELSWASRLRRAFDDHRVVCALAGATCGVLVCGLLTAALVYGLEVQTAHSLAAVMRVLGNPGSDSNPLQLDARMQPPRLAIPSYADDAPELVALPEDDAVYAITGTVTRQGKLTDYAVLGAGGGTHRHGPQAQGPQEQSEQSVARAMSRLRFAPAQAFGETVAVNVVWVVARTTVRGTVMPELSGTGPQGLRRPS